MISGFRCQRCRVDELIWLEGNGPWSMAGKSSIYIVRGLGLSTYFYFLSDNPGQGLATNEYSPLILGSVYLPPIDGPGQVH